MIIAKYRRLIQKLFVLGLLVACLGLFSGDGTKASCEANNNLLPCCSYCDAHPESQLCQHGCLFGCRGK
jgi:hypothetical protein